MSEFECFNSFLAGRFLLKFSVPPKTAFKCDLRASFAAAFKNWRRKHGIPLKLIAADLGLSVSVVSAWELGERFPCGENFERLVEYTGQPPCHLLCTSAAQCRPGGCLRQTAHRAEASLPGLVTRIVTPGFILLSSGILDLMDFTTDCLMAGMADGVFNSAFLLPA